MSEARISESCVFDLPGPGGAGGLRVSVGWPEGEPPARGWPAVLVLDGNRLFPLACHSARAQARRPALTHVEPALVIGLDHVPGGDRPAERLRDLTPEVAPSRLRPRPNGQPWPPVGGAAQLRALIRDEVLPRVAARWRFDPERLAIFGHSLGGVFALDCLLAAPGMFRSYLVSSPSLWFGERVLFDRLGGLEAALRAAGGGRRMLLSVGALEQTVPPERQAAVGQPYLDWLAGNRMVDNTRDLAALLANLPGLELRFRIWEDETHITAPAVAIGQGLRLALRPEPAPGHIPKPLPGEDPPQGSATGSAPMTGGAGVGTALDAAGPAPEARTAAGPGAATADPGTPAPRTPASTVLAPGAPGMGLALDEG